MRDWPDYWEGFLAGFALGFAAMAFIWVVTR